MVFSSVFSWPFTGRRGCFSSAFAGRFAGRGGAVVGYIGPLMAKAAIVAGAPVVMVGNGLTIGGAVLIGPAGKEFEFKSRAAAQKWAANAAGVAACEASVSARVNPARAAAYAAKKRENLRVIAGYVAMAAARQSDAAKRAALLAESNYCLQKWA